MPRTIVLSDEQIQAFSGALTGHCEYSKSKADDPRTTFRQEWAANLISLGEIAQLLGDHNGQSECEAAAKKMTDSLQRDERIHVFNLYHEDYCGVLYCWRGWVQDDAYFIEYGPITVGSPLYSYFPTLAVRNQVESEWPPQQRAMQELEALWQAKLTAGYSLTPEQAREGKRFPRESYSEQIG